MLERVKKKFYRFKIENMERRLYLLVDLVLELKQKAAYEKIS
jgi:hypothetical protein